MSGENRHLQPTVKRRQMARAAGNVVSSSQLTGAVVVLIVSGGFLAWGPILVAAFERVAVAAWRDQWLDTYSAASGQDAILDGLRGVILQVAAYLLPFLLLCLGAAILGRLAQVGFLWAPERVSPELQRLSPARRAGTLITPGALLDVFRLGWVAVLVVGIAGWTIWQQREGLAQLAYDSDGRQILGLLGHVALRLSLCLLGFAALDYACHWYRFEQSLRMTPEEMRDEVRAIDPNPQLESTRRQRHRERLARNVEQS